jgi:hypothetical protein
MSSRLPAAAAIIEATPAVAASSSASGSFLGADGSKWAELLLQGAMVAGLVYVAGAVMSSAERQHKELFQLQQSVSVLHQMQMQQLQHHQQQQAPQALHPPPQSSSRPAPNLRPASTSVPVNPRESNNE